VKADGESRTGDGAKSSVMPGNYERGQQGQSQTGMCAILQGLHAEKSNGRSSEDKVIAPWR